MVKSINNICCATTTISYPGEKWRNNCRTEPALITLLHLRPQNVQMRFSWIGKCLVFANLKEIRFYSTTDFIFDMRYFAEYLEGVGNLRSQSTLKKPKEIVGKIIDSALLCLCWLLIPSCPSVGCWKLGTHAIKKPILPIAIWLGNRTVTNKQKSKKEKQ